MEGGREEEAVPPNKRLTDRTAFERVQSEYDPTRQLYTPVHRFPLQMPHSCGTGCTLSRDSARESAATLNNPSL